MARQRPKNGLTCFKRHFLAKFPGVNGLITFCGTEGRNMQLSTAANTQAHYVFHLFLVDQWLMPAANVAIVPI